MENIYTRTEMMIGGEGVARLRGARVILFGCGGVGSYVAEALARAGVGHIAVVDADKVAPSNLNRQLIATVDTVGRPKAEVQKERIQSINPECEVEAYDMFYDKDTCDAIELSMFDYVCDAIDTVTSKLLLIKKCHEQNVPVISSMGTGNKLDPTRFEVSDISKTSVCPLARVMRRELKSLGISHLKVVYSKEEARRPLSDEDNGHGKRTPASISFVPACAGLIIAGEIIKDIARIGG